MPAAVLLFARGGSGLRCGGTWTVGLELTRFGEHRDLLNRVNSSLAARAV